MYPSTASFTADVADTLVAGPRGLRTHRYVAAASHSDTTDTGTVTLTTSLVATPANTPTRDNIRGRHHGVAHFQLTCDFDPDTLTGSVHVAFSGVWPSEMLGVSLNSAREGHPELSICIQGESASINRAVSTVATHLHCLLTDGMEEYVRSVDGEVYDWADMVGDAPTERSTSTAVGFDRTHGTDSTRPSLLQSFLRGRGN